MERYQKKVVPSKISLHLMICLTSSYNFSLFRWAPSLGTKSPKSPCLEDTMDYMGNNNDGYRVHLVHGVHCRLDFSHISADIWTCDDLSCQARNKQRHLICCTTSRKSKYCYYYQHLITTFNHVR